MKKLQIAVSLLLVLGLATAARAGLDDFLRRVDAQARQDLSRFNVQLSAQFGVPVPRVDEILRRVPSPAEAFMVLQLGQMSNKQPEIVLQAYQSNRDKGWGVVAKELGIKPGSPEFHALKRGEFEFTGKPGGGPHGHGKGKAKNKGKKHK